MRSPRCRRPDDSTLGACGLSIINERVNATWVHKPRERHLRFECQVSIFHTMIPRINYRFSKDTSLDLASGDEAKAGTQVPAPKLKRTHNIRVGVYQHRKRGGTHVNQVVGEWMQSFLAGRLDKVRPSLRGWSLLSIEGETAGNVCERP